MAFKLKFLSVKNIKIEAIRENIYARYTGTQATSILLMIVCVNWIQTKSAMYEWRNLMVLGLFDVKKSTAFWVM